MDIEVIYRAIQGTATPEELDQVAQWHLENPSEFQSYVNEVHMQIDIMKLHGDDIRSTSWIASHWKQIVHVTVQVAAILAIGLFAGGYIGEERAYDIFSTQMNTLQVPYGQRIKLTLSDGSTVQLNAGAKLEYPSVFKKNLRRVKLSGEAFFDVEHNDAKPFVVETFACDIRVLGTKFNVLADAESHRFSTALLDGRVQISNRVDPLQEDIILTPNNVADLSDGRLFVKQIDDPEMFCWTEGFISISGLPFDELMAKFERAFDVKIVINRDSIPEIKNVSGKIRVNDGIDKVLHILKYTADFSYKYDFKTNVVTIY